MYIMNKKINGLDINISFKDKINIIFDESASGKTYLFSIIAAEQRLKGIKCVLIDYNDTESTILGQLSAPYDTNSLLIIDNFDIFDYHKIMRDIVEFKGTILISTKSLKAFVEYKVHDCGIYVVEFDDSSLRVEKVS